MENTNDEKNIELVNKMLKKTEVTTDDKQEPEKLAKDIKISDLSIKDTNTIELEEILKNFLTSSHPTFQIIAAQSGYSAQIKPLLYKDFNKILQSKLTSFEYKKMIMKIIWEKIESMSCGKMTFDKWLASTSLGDLETFYYGLYCSTFKNELEVEITCPFCKEKMPYKFSMNNLQATADKKEMLQHIEDIRTGSKDSATTKALSLLTQTSTIELPDSKLAVTLSLPTILSLLEFLRTTPEKISIPMTSDYISTLLCIKAMYIPASLSDASKVKLDNSNFDNTLQIISIIDHLSIDDAAALNAKVFEILEDKHVSYVLKNITCSNPKCGKKIEDTALDIENILFSQIFEKA